MAADNKAKAAPTTAGKEPTHWVILHNMVGRFPKGEVVPRIKWPEGSSFNDLMKLGAIRQAEPDEIEEGYAEVDPEASKEARAQELAVLRTQIDLLEKENAHLKEKGLQTQAQQPPVGNTLKENEGLKTIIKKKDEAVKELTQRLADPEAARVALAGQVDQLTQALEAATKPAAQPNGGDKK